MSDDPERELRIREEAYRLWEADGRPNGRDAEFWERARELIGMKDGARAGAGLLPNPETQDEPIPGVTIDEASLQDNLGEFPDRMADQGDWRQTPMTRDEQRDYEEDKTQPTRGDAP